MPRRLTLGCVSPQSHSQPPSVPIDRSSRPPLVGARTGGISQRVSTQQLPMASASSSSSGRAAAAGGTGTGGAAAVALPLGGGGARTGEGMSQLREEFLALCHSHAEVR